LNGADQPPSAAGSSVRKAAVDDIPMLVELMREFHGEAGYSLDRKRAAAAFSTLLGDDRLGAAWLLFDQARPAGFVTMTVRFSMECFGFDAFVDDLFVRPASRRRGLGKRALERVVAECGRRGITTLNIVVGRDNDAALELYRAFGFEPPSDGRETMTVRFADRDGSGASAGVNGGSLPDTGRGAR
jgi:GNAT superfamily N-acetyltransferase